MIVKVKECRYKGILLERVESQGWCCNLGSQVYLFPTLVDAQSTINEIFQDIDSIIAKNSGKKMSKRDQLMSKLESVLDEF